jgi:hypothetical protein
MRAIHMPEARKVPPLKPFWQKMTIMKMAVRAAIAAKQPLKNLSSILEIVYFIVFFRDNVPATIALVEMHVSPVLFALSKGTIEGSILSPASNGLLDIIMATHSRSGSLVQAQGIRVATGTHGLNLFHCCNGLRDYSPS